MGEYTVREFEGEDVMRYRQLCATSFHQQKAWILEWEKGLEEIRSEDEKFRSDLTVGGNYTVRTGLFLEERLVAGMTNIAYNVQFDGSVCEMSGIGGVVTDPELRRMGSITRIYQSAFAEMNRRGQVLSHLYPFTAAFYRKYGYEMCATAVEWTIPVEYLPKAEFSGIRHYENTEKQREDIRKVYQAFSQRYNLAVARTDKKWNAFLDRRASYGSEFFSYLHYAGEAADGYFTYTVSEQEYEPMTFEIRNLYFTNVKSLKEMLAFLRSFSSHIKQVKLTLPDDVDLTCLLDEMCGGFGKKNVERAILSVGATRVVNAQRILQIAKYRGKGMVKIGLSDPFCPWNQKNLQVTFDGCCTDIRECADCDVQMDINSFTALILGVYSFAEYPYLGNVTVFGNEENLEKVFYKKPLWIEEHF